jgi:23S rRNA (cytosine1962-C5)-methyltransferase
MSQIVLKPRSGGPPTGRHPWVLASAIQQIEGTPADGDVVDLVSSRGEFVARGIFNSRSRIHVRLYTWEPGQTLDEAFWRRKLETAWALRRRLGYDEPQQAARMVFSEGDGLSGLVVDRYGRFLVVQPTALAMVVRLPELLPMLVDLAQPEGILLRTEADIVRAEGLEDLVAGISASPTAGGREAPSEGDSPIFATMLRTVPAKIGTVPPPRAAELGASPAVKRCDSPPSPLLPSPLSPFLLWGRLPDGPVLLDDHGIQQAVDLTGGQKTGLYLDQRENRPVAAGYFRGGRVLDVFCYTGGFALAAAARGAREVLGVDSSRRAVAEAQANAQRNALTNVRFEAGDAFTVLAGLASAGERFDAVVLDPPRFARSRAAVPQALRAYHRLNALAVRLIVPGGILVTCSCSGHVGREDFLRMLRGVARQVRRDLQVLEARGAAPDHPVSVVCPETEYLKCFICRVEA